MNNISTKQHEVFDYILESTQNGVPPSIREICGAVGLSSTSSVQSILKALEKAGYIYRDPMLKRSIHITGQTEKVTQVPLLGTVAAGQPILADENIECYIPYSGRGSSGKSLFALRVKGESMRDAGILDGDIVFVEQTNVASDREKVVAFWDDEATVKTFFREKGQIRLQPANKDFEPITRNEEEISILGKVIGLVRHYN